MTQADKTQVRLKAIDPAAPFARARTYQELTEMESQLAVHESRVVQMNNSKETLNKRFLELTELKHVLKETAVFFDEVRLCEWFSVA
jgi:V-type H+-transporting ATPase subunit a